jgi:hypothetical protein
MNADSWVTFLHDFATIISTAAAVIAASSSLKNGRTLKNHKVIPEEVVRPAIVKPEKNTTSKDDWYVPPDLN